jgi:uncharacterized protein
MNYWRVLVAVLCLSSFGFSVAPGSSDTDQDGYPDFLELRGNDVRAFNDWFASIAESQFYGVSSDWAVRDRDCAGLLRYAFVNALMPHDSKWFKKFEYLPPVVQPDVRAYSFPVPILSRSVFRDAPGAYQFDDVMTGKLVGRVGAKYLVNYSMVFATKDIRQARRGDMMIFIRPKLESYHTMVYLGNSRIVYHTGGDGDWHGEVRLLRLETIMKHPDTAFHPVSSNPSFLGFYRWKILQ